LYDVVHGFVVPLHEEGPGIRFEALGGGPAASKASWNTALPLKSIAKSSIVKT